MKIDHDNHSVWVTSEQLSFLWKRLLTGFFSPNHPLEFDQYIQDPTSFFSHPTLPDKLANDLTEKTTFDKSKIQLRRNGFTRKYLRDRFFRFQDRSLDRSYLCALIFYIEPKNAFDVKSFFEKNGQSVDDGHFSPALKHLEGTWISFNRNLEKGNVAWCFYKFAKSGSSMEVFREGYLSERLYKGVAHMQEESGGFILELTGQRYHRMKFVLANSQRQMRPEMLRCISSDFGLDNDGQILVKELLVRIPPEKAKDVHLTEGKIVVDKSIKFELKNYFEEPVVAVVLNELEAYLGHNENPTYSFADLLAIKRNHLEEILEETQKPPFIEHLGIYVHFRSLGSDSMKYTRSMVKYKRDDIHLPETAEIIPFVVNDEYTYTKFAKFNKVFPHHYRAEYLAESKIGAVDIQCLFPFLATDAGFDKSAPLPGRSLRIMEASSDLFVTTAQFLNEFLTRKNLSIHFDDYTEKTEMVIDFGSIEDFKDRNIRIESIDYCYHSESEVGPGMVKFKTKDNGARGFSLLKLDKDKKELLVSEELVLDKDNPKLFNLSVNFATQKGESVYINFSLN